MASRILCIDTDPAGLETFRRLFESTEFEVESAATFTQIDLAMRDEETTVVVIEPVLQGIDGFELCRAIRRTYAAREPSVILASRRLRGDAQRDKAADVGARGFFELPDADDELVLAAVAVRDEAGPPVVPVTGTPAPIEKTGRPVWWLAAIATVAITAFALWWGFAPEPVTPAASTTPSTHVTFEEAQAEPVIEVIPAAVISEPSPVIETEAPSREATAAPPFDPARLELPPIPKRRALVPVGAEGLDEPILEATTIIRTVEPGQVDSLVPDELAPPPVVFAPQRIGQSSVEPRYPSIARRLGRKGYAVVQAVVDVSGNVTDVRIVEESDEALGFGNAAADAVAKWTYRPATRDGVPFKDSVTVRLVFAP